jgi:ABC-2 type transport system ATP-binding protein
MEQALVVENLSKAYGKTVAVHDISFAIAPGEIFALIGPNGAGKSTTLRMITTILSPTSGRVQIFGHDIAHESKVVRGLISYLPEEAGAYKNLTGYQYLHFMAELFSSEKEKVASFVTTAEQVSGLGDRLKDKIKTYSKGMTRKLLLARTVMTKPKLAVLDEPTSGLDIINGLEIRKTVKNLSKEGMSVLLSSHNMLEIEFLSDRVGIINKGKLFDVGTPQDLKQKYQAQNLEEVFLKATQS